MRTLYLLLGFAAVSTGQTWIMQTSGTTASLRGVSAVNDRIVWASGTEGTWLRTLDGGGSWESGRVPGAEALDFRGVRGFDERTAVLMSSGSGEKSRIYKTTDGGSHWTLLFTNPDAQGFFDAIAFWNRERGLVMGDAVDGHSVVLTTADGGEHWTRRQTPAALPKEGAFAASNSCLVVRGDREAWFATGGVGAARVLHSRNGGTSWMAASTPLRNDTASSGIFSLAFSDQRHGIAVGGDYTHDKESRGNIALTVDGGAHWSAPAEGGARPRGFRSAIVYVVPRQAWVTTGTSGSDISLNGGKSWMSFDDGAWNAIAVFAGEAWAVGPKGRIARLFWK